jgi:hypothetical protein
VPRPPASSLLLWLAPPDVAPAHGSSSLALPDSCVTIPVTAKAQQLKIAARWPNVYLVCDRHQGLLCARADSDCSFSRAGLLFSTSTNFMSMGVPYHLDSMRGCGYAYTVCPCFFLLSFDAGNTLLTGPGFHMSLHTYVSRARFGRVLIE